LPNLIGISRGIANMRRPLAGNNPIPWDHNLHDINGPPVVIGHNAASTMNSSARIMPGTIQPVGFSARLSRMYQEDLSHINFPTFAADALPVSWSGYFGLDVNMYWFSELAAQMHLTGSHFKGQASLADIAVQNGGIPLVLSISDAVYPNRNAHRAAPMHRPDYMAHQTSLTTEIQSPADKYATLTQINFVPANNYGPNDNAGRIGHTRNGPWWTVGQDRMRSIPNDPTIQVPVIVKARFYVSKPTS
jgi:hypothetical protein